MRQLRPVDYVADIDIPPSGYFTDESMDGPVWGTSEMSMTFFGRDGWQWVRHLVDRKGLYLDGKKLDVPRRTDTDWRVWRLIDVERFAHATAKAGHLSVEQLYRVLTIVRYVAESWDYIPQTPIPIRMEAHDSTRKEAYAVGDLIETTDDLDGSRGASQRTFALGDVEYIIDLTDEHWQDLVSSLATYVTVSRRNAGRTDVPADRANRNKIRIWAREFGYPVGLRGRIPQATMDAYATRGK